jgi:Ribbon-helix-helix protein, copG family
MADPSSTVKVLIAGRSRHRGRPREPHPRVWVTTYMPETVYDQLCAHARREDRSLSSVVREAVAHYLRPRD